MIVEFLRFLGFVVGSDVKQKSSGEKNSYFYYSRQDTGHYPGYSRVLTYSDTELREKENKIRDDQKEFSITDSKVRLGLIISRDWSMFSLYKRLKKYFSLPFILMGGVFLKSY